MVNESLLVPMQAREAPFGNSSGNRTIDDLHPARFPANEAKSLSAFIAREISGADSKVRAAERKTLEALEFEPRRNLSAARAAKVRTNARGNQAKA
jgi:hypothetical protein